MENCTAIILAGGQGSRLKRLGQFVSKAALVVYDQPMLMRHLDHLLEAGFRNILITTNALHYPVLAGLADTYRHIVSRESIGDLNLRVLNNPDHPIGPTEALRTAMRQITTRRTLIVLVDEFSRGNPYAAFAPLVDEVDEYGGIAEPIDVQEMKRGGYVVVRNGEIVGYVEQTGMMDSDGYPSTGTSLTDTALMLEDCDRFIADHPGASSIGDFFDYRVMQLGRRIKAIMEPDFVNINTPEFLLLANLYAAMERLSDTSPHYEEMVRLAQSLRTSVHQRY